MTDLGAFWAMVHVPAPQRLAHQEARAVRCEACGVLLPDPATTYPGGVSAAWCDDCGRKNGTVIDARSPW